MKISVICVCNNCEQVKDCLQTGLTKQSVDYELILLDGAKGKFSSCAAALNKGAKNSLGDILIFTHQDIYLKSENDLVTFCNFIHNSPIGTIVGAAGAVEKSKVNIGNYTSGEIINEEIVSNISQPIKVDNIDECFFGMSKATYEMHHFNELLCDDWHLYAVEQCLYHRANGDSIYVFPIQIHHLSNGKINLSYMNCLIKISDEYRDKFKYIWTTCYKVRSNYLYVRVLRIIWIINRRIRHRSM